MIKPIPKKWTLIIYRRDKDMSINYNWELVESEPPDTVDTVMQRRGIDKHNYFAVCELDRKPKDKGEFLTPLLGRMNKIQMYEYERRTDTDEEAYRDMRKTLEILKNMIHELTTFICRKFRINANAIDPDRLPDEADIATPSVDMTQPPDMPERYRPSM